MRKVLLEIGTGRFNCIEAFEGLGHFHQAVEVVLLLKEFATLLIFAMRFVEFFQVGRRSSCRIRAKVISVAPDELVPLLDDSVMIIGHRSYADAPNETPVLASILFLSHDRLCIERLVNVFVRVKSGATLAKLGALRQRRHRISLRYRPGLHRHWILLHHRKLLLELERGLEGHLLLVEYLHVGAGVLSRKEHLLGAVQRCPSVILTLFVFY